MDPDAGVGVVVGVVVGEEDFVVVAVMVGDGVVVGVVVVVVVEVVPAFRGTTGVGLPLGHGTFWKSPQSTSWNESS